MAKQKKTPTVIIELPIKRPRAGDYRTRHYDVQLTARQREAHRWLFDGLNDSASRMNNHKFVQHARHVPQFILDAVADEIGLDEKGSVTSVNSATSAVSANSAE